MEAATGLPDALTVGEQCAVSFFFHSFFFFQTSLCIIIGGLPLYFYAYIYFYFYFSLTGAGGVIAYGMCELGKALCGARGIYQS